MNPDAPLVCHYNESDPLVGFSPECWSVLQAAYMRPPRRLLLTLQDSRGFPKFPIPERHPLLPSLQVPRHLLLSRSKDTGTLLGMDGEGEVIQGECLGDVSV
jgi:hypothetical protein